MRLLFTLLAVSSAVADVAAAPARLARPVEEFQFVFLDGDDRAPVRKGADDAVIPVRNSGTEPAVVRGAAAIIAASGALVGKVALDSRRLLPGERTVLRADYAGELSPGSYRVIATIESAQQSWTRTTELNIR